MAIRLFSSNRLETLIEVLAEILQTPLSSILEKEVVLVQSKGMERWISMELAGRHGICCNYQFSFPNVFINEIFAKVVPDLSQRSQFEPGIMTWRIMEILHRWMQNSMFEEIRHYLREGDVNLKCLQLAERISDTFDQYLLFRPEMILDWEKGHEDHWQAVLWRELNNPGEWHRANVGKTFFSRMELPSVKGEDLPERICVFGISALPRFYIQVLSSISKFTSVNLFLMNPCREYWGDIVSDWEIRRVAGQGDREIAEEELHLEKGNSLLASMGTLGRDFFELINQSGCEEVPVFLEPGRDNILSCIQSDILNLRNIRYEDDARRIIKKDDTSLGVHSCHSPMREIEILQDRLLNLFANDPGLTPGDILVMTPDIETYVPYIHAVFDLPVDDLRLIPFSITDRNIKDEGEIIDTFFDVLTLTGGRLSAPRVLSILESHAVLHRFDLSEQDVEIIRKWVEGVGIRWGMDEKSREKLDLPSFRENTWKAGIERLLMGYAMPGMERLFEGILPYDSIEGSDTEVLGKFLEFLEQVFYQLSILEQPHTLGQWSEVLTELLAGLFLTDGSAKREMQLMSQFFGELKEAGSLAGFDEAVDINIIRWHLGHCFKEKGFGHDFMNGGVTFCAMLPMRSIPFRVICLLGMNGDAYPRQSKPMGFDLMAKHPQPGDRSRRNDDRYLFLEAIFSAREKLYISYVGQSAQDNSTLSPSVLVSELLDYIEQGFEVRGGDILDHVVTRHRLQAFSPEYFKKDKNFFSYSEQNLRAAECLTGERHEAGSFFTEGMKRPGEEWRDVDLNALCNFFINPAKFMLNARLGLYLGEAARLPEESENFDIKGLDKYLFAQNLLTKKMAGHNLKDLYPLAMASGQLPHGAVGKCMYDGLKNGVVSFTSGVEPFMQGAVSDPLDISVNISSFRLSGRIDTIYQERLLLYRYAKIKSKDHLRAWIYHLALSSMPDDFYPGKSILVGLSPRRPEPEWEAWGYPPLSNAKEILEKLLHLYWSGLSMPLHFFPESSWDYAFMLLEKKKAPEEALKSAGRVWKGNEFTLGECKDDYYQLCFTNSDPFDSEFQNLSKDIFGPIIKYRNQIWLTDLNPST